MAKKTKAQLEVENEALRKTERELRRVQPAQDVTAWVGKVEALQNALAQEKLVVDSLKSRLKTCGIDTKTGHATHACGNPAAGICEEHLERERQANIAQISALQQQGDELRQQLRILGRAVEQEALVRAKLATLASDAVLEGNGWQNVQAWTHR